MWWLQADIAFQGQYKDRAPATGRWKTLRGSRYRSLSRGCGLCATPQNRKYRLNILIIDADHDSCIALTSKPARRGQSRCSETCR